MLHVSIEKANELERGEILFVSGIFGTYLRFRPSLTGSLVCCILLKDYSWVSGVILTKFTVVPVYNNNVDIATT